MTISLPVHPYTGLTALGLRRDGMPIWPVAGGSEPPVSPVPPAPPVPQPPADPKPDDKPLGEGGLKALQAERDRVSALEKELAPLKQLAAAIAGGKPAGKTEIEVINETLAQQADLIKKQSMDLLRRDVADEKKLSAAQAAMLVGSTKEELNSHADKLIELFGAGKKEDGDGDPKPGVKKGLKPDPAQGTGGGAKPSAADAGRAEAAKRFGTKTAATT